MRLAIVGANGGIGTQLTRQALAAGHHVVAPVDGLVLSICSAHRARHVPVARL